MASSGSEKMGGGAAGAAPAGAVVVGSPTRKKKRGRRGTRFATKPNKSVKNEQNCNRRFNRNPNNHIRHPIQPAVAEHPEPVAEHLPVEHPTEQGLLAVLPNRQNRSTQSTLEILSDEDDGMLLPDTLTDLVGRKKYSTDALRARRMAIYYFFTEHYGSNSDEQSWRGRNGIVAKIRRDCHLPPGRGVRRSIKSTLKIILQCQCEGKTYTGERQSRTHRKGYYIETDSYKATMIADMIEADFGFTETTKRVNIY